MEAVFKRVVYLDEWREIKSNLTLGSSFEWQNYVLGWRMVGTERELRLIEENNMWGEKCICLHEGDGFFNFAGALRPEWIPEVRKSVDHQLHIQSKVMAEAAKWTLFFESMDETG